MLFDSANSVPPAVMKGFTKAVSGHAHELVSASCWGKQSFLDFFKYVSVCSGF
jgi:hypothetical protein